MLSTRQAHHILRLADRHDAQGGVRGRHQTAAAGGGGAGVEIDPRCRRQRPGGPHPPPEGRTSRTSWFMSMARRRTSGAVPGGPDGRGGAHPHPFSHYEAMADKAGIHALAGCEVSAALRDGDAAQAIQAWHERGRFHLGFNEETDAHGLACRRVGALRRGSTPEKSSVVLARTRAEARALSHLMRERRFARQTAPRANMPLPSA